MFTHEDVRAHHAGLVVPPILDPQDLTDLEQREAAQVITEWKAQAIPTLATAIVDDLTDDDLKLVLSQRHKVAQRQAWAAAMDSKQRTKFKDLRARDLDARRAEARQTIPQAARAFEAQVAMWDVGEFPSCGDPQFDGTSRLSDIITDYDSAALPVLTGSRLKMQLAQAVNVSTFEGTSGHIEQAGDGRNFHRGVSDVSARLGDLFQLDAGEYAVTAVEVTEGSAPVRYLVESRKRPLPGKRGREIWFAVHGGQRIWRKSSWIYEPVRQIPLVGSSRDEAEQAALRWQSEIRDLGRTPEWDFDDIEADRVAHATGMTARLENSRLGPAIP